MQIAKMFGALGFQVDLTGLQQFQSEMKRARAQIRAFASDSRQTEISVKSLTAEVKKLKSSLNLNIKTSGVTSGFQSISKEIKNTAGSFSNFERKATSLNASVDSIQVKLDSAIPAWERYRLEVESTARALGAIRGTVPTARSGSNTNSGNSQKRESSSPNTSALYFGGLAGGGFFNSARQAIVGGMASAVPFALGAMTKNIISSGRDMRSAEQVLLAHSLNENDFKGNNQFIKKLTDETGTDITESIRGYGRVLSASRAGGGTTQQAQNVFEAFSKYGTTMHLNQDENKRMIKAVEQIYTNQRILGGEINQFANVGIPMKAILKEISNGHLGGNSKEVVPEEIKKLAGSKAPNTVQLAEWIAKYLMNTAMNNGAYEKALHSSQAEQGRASNQWKEFSTYVMENGGDDALASFYRLVKSAIGELKSLATAINLVGNAINGITGSSNGSKFLWLLIAMIIPFGRLGKSASILTRLMRSFSGYMTKSGRAITMASGATGGLIARFSVLFLWLWRLAGRWIVIIGLMQLASKLTDDITKNGETKEITWVDRYSLALQNLSIRLFILRLRWLEFKNSLSIDHTEQGLNPTVRKTVGSMGILGGVGIGEMTPIDKKYSGVPNSPLRQKTSDNGNILSTQVVKVYLKQLGGDKEIYSGIHHINLAHDTINQAHVGF